MEKLELEPDNILAPSTNNAVQNGIKPQNIFIADNREMYKSYMPYIKGGGIFISCSNEAMANISVNKKAFVILSYLNKKYPISGKIVWINKGKGYGVAFGDAPLMKALKNTIETNISEFYSRKESTYTI